MLTIRSHFGVAAVLLAVVGGALFAQSGRIRVRTGPITVNPNVNVRIAAMRLHDDGRPGPDAAQVATLLATLGRTDATVCEMAVDVLGTPSIVISLRFDRVPFIE